MHKYADKVSQPAPQGSARAVAMQRADTGAMQRKINTYVENQNSKMVHLKADGFVNEFQGGEKAGDYGWNGVTKYKAQYLIKDNGVRGETAVLSNNYLQAHAGHSLAKQNGGEGGNINIFAQDGGVNTTGPWISFENEMRDDLDNAEESYDVVFDMFLAGDKITNEQLDRDRMPDESFSKKEMKFFNM